MMLEKVISSGNIDLIAKSDNEIQNDVAAFKRRILHSMSNADYHIVLEIVRKNNDYYAVVEYEMGEVQYILYSYNYNGSKYLLQCLTHLDSDVPISAILLDPVKYNLNIGE